MVCKFHKELLSENGYPSPYHSNLPPGHCTIQPSLSCRNHYHLLAHLPCLFFKRDLRLRSFLPQHPKVVCFPEWTGLVTGPFSFPSKSLTFCCTVLNWLMGNPGLLACTLQTFAQCWNGLSRVLIMWTTPRTMSCDTNHNTTMVECSLQCCIYEVPNPEECLQICGHSLCYFFLREYVPLLACIKLGQYYCDFFSLGCN